MAFSACTPLGELPASRATHALVRVLDQRSAASGRPCFADRNVTFVMPFTVFGDVYTYRSSLSGRLQSWVGGAVVIVP